MDWLLGYMQVSLLMAAKQAINGSTEITSPPVQIPGLAGQSI